jgi:hypothetical protein
MPVVINEMTSHFDVRDESKLKKLICKEVKTALEEEKRRKSSRGDGTDPSDPAASGRPEGG